MKILLVYISGETDRRDPYITLLPTGLCSLHAVLREAGFDAILANFSGWSRDRINRQVTELKPDVVGISQWTHNRHASFELARVVRAVAPKSFIVFGGAHATFSYLDLLFIDSPVDCIVLGEGEETLLEVVRRLEQGKGLFDVPGIALLSDGEVVVTAARTLLKSLDVLPIAVSYLEHSVGVDTQLQAEFIITTRGCPSACYFCSSPKFWSRKARFRSPGNIVHEIECIRDRYGLIYFSIRDDTFTVDRARTLEFCRTLIDRHIRIVWNCQSRVTTLDEELLVWMKRAGCECIQLGVESGSQRVLKQLNKSITTDQVEAAAALIRKVGINLSIYLITDIPGETEEDIRQSISLVRKIRPDDGYVSPLAYFPGTRLFDDAVDAGTVGRDVFTKCSDSAVFAQPRLSGSSNRILTTLGQATQVNIKRFQEQKRLLGFCFVTNVLTGEYFRSNSDYVAAENEFREIAEREPDNPWGWYLLAELYAETGRFNKAEECYRAVCTLVPHHEPSLRALKAKKKRG